MNHSEAVNLYVGLGRKIFGHFAIYSDNFDNEIIRILNINSSREYGFIIDSYYLLEDTRKAKENFRRFGVEGPTKYREIGEAYLRVYGMLNACFLQKEAVFSIAENLSLTIDKKEMENLVIIALRNTFAAHTANRGKKSDRRSYILDKNRMLEGTLAGYSANRESGVDFIDEDIITNLDEWDVCLAQTMKSITERLLKTGDADVCFGENKAKPSTVLARIIASTEGRCAFPDIWA